MTIHQVALQWSPTSTFKAYINKSVLTGLALESALELAGSSSGQAQTNAYETVGMLSSTNVLSLANGPY